MFLINTFLIYYRKKGFMHKAPLMIFYVNLLYFFCVLVDLPPDSLIELLTEMAEIEVRLNGGTSEKIHLGSLISAFHMIRSKLKPADEV